MTKTPGSKPNDCEVGYRRPPRASQVQQGTSGNPRGRRKGSRSVGAILNGIMSQKVTVSEGGRMRRVSRLEVTLLRLIINMPPRSLKSITASVAFPAFVLGHDPTRRIICVSYSGDLAKKHANDFRAVMEDGWYRELFPGTRIGQKDSESEIELTARGFRLASHRRAQLKRQESTSRTNHEGNASELEIPTDQHNPETALIEREDTDIVTAIYECLAGDDEAQFVIMALADGKKGEELRDEIGIDQAAYDHAMRRIRKALAKKFRKGIPS